MTRPRLQLEQEYDPRSVEKVERLLELLEALARNPFLEKRLVLHGGTALNLFHLPRVRRLSVDIDLLYVGAVSREAMLEERDEVVGQLFSEARLLDYHVGTPKEDHAGLTSRMSYGDGRDQIKVDLNFLDRVPVRGWATAWARPLASEVAFACLQPSELAARKVCALFGRVAVRDLYDLQGWSSLSGDPAFAPLAVYYYSLADSFPQRPLDVSVLARFSGRQNDVERDLYPMLTATERPSVEELVSRVAPLFESLSQLAPEHGEYLRLLTEENDYRPGLLFGDYPEALEAARVSPRMEWKLQNLRSRPT
jgi:predicted nucleotidyltransferase component of viral defense system